MSEDHWAWKIPTEEFFPLGDGKLNSLLKFAKKCLFSSAAKNSYKLEDFAAHVLHDRKLASQVYVVCKDKILEMIEKENKQKISNQKTKSKEKFKMTKPIIGNILNFQHFKKLKKKAS